MTSKGYCAPGYEPVRQLFNSHLLHLEKNAQVCAYVNGQKVVDLYGSSPTTPFPARYTATTVQNIYSSTKAITSLVVAMLEDRGHLHYDQPVSDLWPEYAAHNKGNTTIAQVMRHEAGLPKLALPARDLTTAQIKAGAAGHHIAGATPTPKR